MKAPVFTLLENQDVKFGSNRYVATPIRHKLELFLEDHKNIILDFSRVPNATQSWVDELLGKLVLKDGKELLNRIQFKNCTPNLRELIKFVVTDRVQDHEKLLLTH